MHVLGVPFGLAAQCRQTLAITISGVLQGQGSESGQLAVDVLEMCFSMLPRIQLLDGQVGGMMHIAVGPQICNFVSFGGSQVQMCMATACTCQPGPSCACPH